MLLMRGMVGNVLSGQDDKDVEEIDLVSDSEPHNGDNDLDDMDASGSVASAGAQDSDYQDDSDFIPDNKPKPTTPNRPLQSSDSVACPNCLTHVRQARINWHLDRCLAGKLTEDQPSSISQHTSLGSRSGQTKLQLPAPPSTKNMLPKPTKLAYSLLSEAKLRRTLRELGIPSKGDKHQMQARHIEWINMYMANADSETPVSHRMLLRRLASWEESLNRSSETKTHTLSTPRDMTDHTLKYADSFASLVSQADANRSKNPVQ
ncbi:E3 ubiquitin-protein ligase rad18 [Coemansia sp. Benny D115]|nr:E3 ubiquitin-protein ligase rad18 [Coemansia sp. Benny D115]